MSWKLLSVDESNTRALSFGALKVTIVCFGGIRRYLPAEATGNRTLLEIPDHADVGTAVEALGAPARSVFAVLVDGQRSSLESRLHDGAEIILMPPFSGGARGVAVVTISDGVAAGEREDRSGEAVAALLKEIGYDASPRIVVADEADEIETELRRLVGMGMALVCTTGGTGLGPRDITPEATKRVLEREAPGISELIRQTGTRETKRAALSRGVAGTAGKTLIVNLPGNPRGATTSLRALIDILDHALDLVAGDTHHHQHAGNGE